MSYRITQGLFSSIEFFKLSSKPHVYRTTNCKKIILITQNINVNLNQVTVPSIDLQKSIEFYKKLGLELIVHSGPDYARFLCPNGNTTFSLHKTNELPKGDGVYVYFECEDLDEKVKELKNKGIKFDLEPTNQTWLWREARLKDVDGNQLILFYAGENRINPPWKLK